jgi:hypothetical protein
MFFLQILSSQLESITRIHENGLNICWNFLKKKWNQIYVTDNIKKQVHYRLQNLNLYIIPLLRFIQWIQTSLRLDLVCLLG